MFRIRRPTIQIRRAWQNPRQYGARLFRSIRPSPARPVTAMRQGNRTSVRFSVTHAMARIHGRAMALTAVATAVGLSTRLHQHQPHPNFSGHFGISLSRLCRAYRKRAQVYTTHDGWFYRHCSSHLERRQQPRARPSRPSMRSSLRPPSHPAFPIDSSRNSRTPKAYTALRFCVGSPSQALGSSR